MSLYVDPLEALWVLVNGTTLVLTVLALRESIGDRRLAIAANGTNHPARVVVAKGNVRREFLRSVVQVLLLSIVIPGLFIDRPVPLNPIVLALIAVPVILCVSTLFDRRERGVVLEMLVEGEA